MKRGVLAVLLGAVAGWLLHPAMGVIVAVVVAVTIGYNIERMIERIGMGRKDDRTDKEKADWNAGQFTEKEARDAGMTQEQMNQARADQERELGNPLAPPE